MIRFRIATLLILLTSTNILAQQHTSTDIDEIGKDDRVGWSNTSFIALGYGTPQGLRAEAGYRFGTFLALGFMFGIYDTWSSDPEEGTGGIFGQIHIPFGGAGIATHTFIGIGTTLTIFGKPDTYWLAHVGITYPVNHFLTLRPELGLVSTSRWDYVPDGTVDRWGNANRQNVETTDSHFGIHLALEIDLRPIF